MLYINLITGSYAIKINNKLDRLKRIDNKAL